MAEQLRPYMCKYFKWTSWRHYGNKMPEYACELKGGVMGSCGGICKKFERKDGTNNGGLDR